MSKSKKREKVKRRGESGKKTSGGGGGAMMGMRSGIKGVAGSITGQKSVSKKTRRVVDIFWWIVTIAVGSIAAYLLYNRFK